LSLERTIAVLASIRYKQRMSDSPSHTAIFCKVVDNFGDIGVCWRLARQLAQEQGHVIALYVDDLASFARLEPEVNTHLPEQTLFGIQIIRWHEPFHVPQPLPNLVIETFSCRLPEALVAALANADPVPRWVNLEHLTAEDWAISSHGLISVHPTTGLKREFHIPGFAPASGGLLREGALLHERDAFMADVTAQQHWWLNQLGIRKPEGLMVSLFAYPYAPYPVLMQALRERGQPVTLLVPESVNHPALVNGHNIRLIRFPFLRQPDYDRLLWSCDLNFVRGEDSFIRALWAGKPFIWQAYAQSEDAHMSKVDAFLRLYTQKMPQKCAEALEFGHSLWNLSPAAAPEGLTLLLERLPELDSAARQASNALAAQQDCVSRLLRLPITERQTK